MSALIVEDVRRAQSLLEGTGRVVKAPEVVAIEAEDRAGGLAKLLHWLDEAEVAEGTLPHYQNSAAKARSAA